KFTDNCGNPFKPSDLGVAQIYVAGPRETLQTRTALKLMNAIGDRNVADRQHHFVSFINPSYGDPSQNNLGIADDGTVAYKLAPVSDEAIGTYTVGVWAKSKDNTAQSFALQDIQIGTGTQETFV